MNDKEISDQQDKALSILHDMTIKMSEYQQMGFIEIARAYREEIRRIEKWIQRLPNRGELS
jgi:hypothetical protein